MSCQLSLWTFLDNFFFLSPWSFILQSGEFPLSELWSTLSPFSASFPLSLFWHHGDWSGTWLMIILWAYMDSPDILIAAWWLFIFFFPLFYFLTIPNVWFDSQWQIVAWCKCLQICLVASLKRLRAWIHALSQHQLDWLRCLSLSVTAWQKLLPSSLWLLCFSCNRAPTDKSLKELGVGLNSFEMASLW